MNFGYGFISHFWYNALDRMVTATGVSRVVKKMLIDQFLFTPCCQILFYSGNSIMEVMIALLADWYKPHDQPHAALEKLRGCLLPSLLVETRK